MTDAGDSGSQLVSVTAPNPDGITLSANGFKNRSRHNADLTWSGATSTTVDVYRDGNLITTTANEKGISLADQAGRTESSSGV